MYLLGLSKSFASYTLYITSLSPDSGEVIHSGNVPSSIKTGLSQAFVLNDVRAPDTTPRVVWFEDGRIKSVELTPELNAKPAVVKGAVYKTIEDVGLSEYGQFVAIAEDGAGRVIKLTPEGLKVIWEYSDSVRLSLLDASQPGSGRLELTAYPVSASTRPRRQPALALSTQEAWMSMATRILRACSGCIH